MHRRTDRMTERQTECINTFHLCWKVLKNEEVALFHSFSFMEMNCIPLMLTYVELHNKKKYNYKLTFIFCCGKSEENKCLKYVNKYVNKMC